MTKNSESIKIGDKYLISICLGDEGGDGHSMTSTYNFLCNVDLDTLSAAYKESKKTTGLNFDSEVCGEAEENYIEGKLLEKMLELGFDLSVLEENEDKNDTYRGGNAPYLVDEDGYLNILWQFVRISNPKIEIEYIELPKFGRGQFGYGIFNCL